MAAAKPFRMTTAGQPAAGMEAVAESVGPTVSVDPAAAPTETAAAAETTASMTPTPLHSTAVPRPYTNFPDRLNGKVFFTMNGSSFVCSGTAVNSENKSIVWTAGHCVHGGRGGRFHTNWAFVPAYSSSFNGHRPYGTWTARELWTRTEWSANSNFRQDVGAVVVNRVGNIRLVDRIGGQGILFNASRSQNYSSFGYPQAAPFNGLSQFRCNSGLVANDFPPGVGPATMKIHCNMTGGSSGGGWLVNLSTAGLGFVNSVNSYRYNTTPDHLFGPYHGNEALSLYNAVRNRPA